MPARDLEVLLGIEADVGGSMPADGDELLADGAGFAGLGAGEKPQLDEERERQRLNRK